jgi:hypothetical protein
MGIFKDAICDLKDWKRPTAFYIYISKNYNASLKQFENIISLLGTFGHVSAHLGTKRHDLAILPHPSISPFVKREATFVILMADVHTKEQRSFNMSVLTLPSLSTSERGKLHL